MVTKLQLDDTVQAAFEAVKGESDPTKREAKEAFFKRYHEFLDRGNYPAAMSYAVTHGPEHRGVPTAVVQLPHYMILQRRLTDAEETVARYEAILDNGSENRIPPIKDIPALITEVRRAGFVELEPRAIVLCERYRRHVENHFPQLAKEYFTVPPRTGTPLPESARSSAAAR